MSTTKIGRKAENAVAKCLKQQGYKILVQNWRTRWCEVDVVATKNRVVFFIEVKYRAQNDWGDGLEAITNKKLKQMQFAAQQWVTTNDWDGDYRLAVASVTGRPLKIKDFFEL